MNFTQLLAQLNAKRASIQARFDALDAEGRGILATAEADNQRNLTEQENERSLAIVGDRATLRSQLADVDSQIASVTAERDADAQATRDAETTGRTVDAPVGGTRAVSPGRVGREERTYSRENAWERSFFQDMYNGQFRGDGAAAERIQQHMREARAEGELTERAGTSSGFVGLVPPQYLTDQAALLARAGRPTADSVQHLQLPPSGMSIVVPRQTTGATASVQSTENTPVSNTDEVWSNLTVPVVTIAGQQVLSRQAVERGEGIDQLIFNDLYQAYNVALDQQVLSGTGSAGQMLGILNTSGVYQASAFTAAAVVTTLYPKLLGAVNAVETGRYLAPNLIVMHPRRFNWLLTQFDSQNRPLVVPNMNGPFNAIGVADAPPADTAKATPAGWIVGIPIVTDANIPTAVGTGPEDQIIVAHKEDLLLWENGDGAPFQLRFDQPLANQLSVQLVAYNYAAFTAGRYPSAVGIVGGNAASGFGLVAPTF